MTDSDSMKTPLCHSAVGSIVSLDYCTPDTGYEPNVMELTGTTELNNAASSDIYFQDSLEDTASLSDPYIDDDELGKLLAIVVDRTGQPVLERTDSDHFPCSVRNLKILTGYAPNDMELINDTELNDSVPSKFTDFQDSLVHFTPSLDHYVDDETLGKLLAEVHRDYADYRRPEGVSVSPSSMSVMVDRTGKPVEKSDFDQFWF